MKQTAISVFKKITIASGIGLLALSAQAGAPGYDNLDGVRITPALIEAPAQRELSPAEIRNAVSIRMDELEAQGIEVDRAAVDGIGLDDFDDKMVEAQPE